MNVKESLNLSVQVVRIRKSLLTLTSLLAMSINTDVHVTFRIINEMFLIYPGGVRKLVLLSSPVNQSGNKS
jgi:high-affinity K+ transport system ATPase subunit B